MMHVDVENLKGVMYTNSSLALKCFVWLVRMRLRVPQGTPFQTASDEAALSEDVLCLELRHPYFTQVFMQVAPYSALAWSPEEI
jgi:hypothetical protein